MAEVVADKKISLRPVGAAKGNPIRLQSRLSLRLLIAQGSANLVSGALLRAGSQHVATSLAHVVLLLHGGQLLVLGKGQGKGNTEEQGRGGDDPGALAAE